jgi:CRISPR-associated protein Csx3
MAHSDRQILSFYYSRSLFRSIIIMTTPSDSGIALSLGDRQQVNSLSFQILTIQLTRRDRLIEPQDLAQISLPPGIDTSGGVVLYGRAPIWLYSFLVHELHPTAWVACYDPRFPGAVVVSTHSRHTRIGQVIPLPIDVTRRPARLCPALMLVGPPDSGKSVISHTLFKALLPDYPDIFLHRAHWDGEGNWILELDETATADDRELFKQTYKGGKSDRFFPYHAQSILELRRQKQLVLVDVGGMVQIEKVPVLEACTHYLIVSRDPAEISKWHEFCRDRGNLTPVAVIHTFLSNETADLTDNRAPYWSMELGEPWFQSPDRSLPEEFLQQVRSLIQ